MAGTELLDDVPIVLRALVDILDHQGNGCTRREFDAVFDKRTGEYLHRVGFAPLCRET